MPTLVFNLQRTVLSLGDVLYINRSRPMATIVADTCGRHDFLLTPCSQQTFDLIYPQLEGAPPQLPGEPALPDHPRVSAMQRAGALSRSDVHTQTRPNPKGPE